MGIGRFHRSQSNDTSIIANKPGRMERTIKEAVEIELHPENARGKLLLG
jgi:carbon monoxide dehydrogenase subunit G